MFCLYLCEEQGDCLYEPGTHALDNNDSPCQRAPSFEGAREVARIYLLLLAAKKDTGDRYLHPRPAQECPCPGSVLYHKKHTLCLSRLEPVALFPYQCVSSRL